MNSNKDKEMSKRQIRREQIRQKEMRGKLLGIGAITFGAILLAFLIIYPSVQKANITAEILTAAPQEYPQADKTSLGDPNAKVKIDVYEDFQCPACLQFSQNVEPSVIENLVKTGKVYYTFHNYPFLDGDGVGKGESDQAANAGMCAAEQGKFWEMHGTIFANWKSENRGAFSNARLRIFAEKTGLKMDAFNACFDANTYKQDIQADFDSGKQIGVNGTPSVFVNGTIVNSGGIPSYAEIAAAVEAASK